MYDSFSSRLDFVVSKIGGVGKACTAAEITPPTLTRWKDGSSDPKISNLQAFAKAGGVTIDWLINGEGEASNQSQNTQKQELSDDDYVYIPAYDIKVSAGHGAFTEGASAPLKHMAFRRRYIKARNLDLNHLAVLFTTGDSMEPTIPENATILVDRTKQTAMDGKVYVIRIDDRLWVKRTQWTPSGGLRLISDNKNYDSFDINKADFAASNVEVIGQVIHAAYDLPD